MKKTTAVIVVSIILIYVISFGPMGWAFIKITSHIDQKYGMMLSKILVTIYLPHMYLMGYSETYFNYGNLWVKWGNGSSVLPESYIQFKDRLKTQGLY